MPPSGVSLRLDSFWFAYLIVKKHRFCNQKTFILDLLLITYLFIQEMSLKSTKQSNKFFFFFENCLLFVLRWQTKTKLKFSHWLLFWTFFLSLVSTVSWYLCVDLLLSSLCLSWYFLGKFSIIISSNLVFSHSFYYFLLEFWLAYVGLSHPVL